MRSQRSTAWLSGQLQFHINVNSTPEGTYKATANGYDGFEGTGEHEHQAVNELKQKVRQAAMAGEL